MSHQVLDRDAETVIARARGPKGSTSMTSLPQSVDPASGSPPGQRRAHTLIDYRLATALPTALAALAAVILVSHSPVLAVLLVAVGLAFVGLGLNRAGIYPAVETIVLIGRGPLAAVIASTIEARSDGNRPVSVLRAISPAEAATMLRTARCDEVIIAGLSNYVHGDLVDARGIRPEILSGAEKMELLLGRIPLEFASQDKWLGQLRTLNPSYAHGKRALDLAFALGLGLIILPLFPLIAVAIKLDSRGPVVYSQRRIGLGGKPFKIYKFRSMEVDAEANGAVWAQARDSRVTRVGRFHASDSNRRAAADLERDPGRNGGRRTAPGAAGVHRNACPRDSQLRSPSHRQAWSDRLGAGLLPLHQHDPRHAGEGRIRSVLRQASFAEI